MTQTDYVLDLDDNPADYLGKCFSKTTRGEPYIDRREGILYSGETLSETRTFKIVEKAIADMDWPTTFQFPDGMYLLCGTKEDQEWLKAGEKNSGASRATWTIATSARSPTSRLMNSSTCPSGDCQAPCTVG
jgi:hypothetical protein